MVAINGIVWQAHAGKAGLLSIPSGMQAPGAVNAYGRQLLLLTGCTHLPVQKRSQCEVFVLSLLGVRAGK